MLVLPNLCSFQMGSPVLAKGLPSRLLRSSLVPLLSVQRSMVETPAQLLCPLDLLTKKKLVPETSATATLALISVVSTIAWLQSNLLFTKILQGTGRCSQRKSRNWQRRVNPSPGLSPPGNQSPERGQAPGLVSAALEQIWPMVALWNSRGCEWHRLGPGWLCQGKILLGN